MPVCVCCACVCAVCIAFYGRKIKQESVMKVKMTFCRIAQLLTWNEKSVLRSNMFSSNPHQRKERRATDKQ